MRNALNVVDPATFSVSAIAELDATTRSAVRIAEKCLMDPADVGVAFQARIGWLTLH